MVAKALQSIHGLGLNCCGQLSWLSCCYGRIPVVCSTVLPMVCPTHDMFYPWYVLPIVCPTHIMSYPWCVLPMLCLTHGMSFGPTMLCPTCGMSYPWYVLPMVCSTLGMSYGPTHGMSYHGICTTSVTILCRHAARTVCFISNFKIPS